MQVLDVPAQKQNVGSSADSAPVICCAIYGVLARAQAPNWLPQSLSPERVQADLFTELYKEDDSFSNTAAEEQPGKSWPKVVKAWLLGEVTGTQVCKHARKHLGFLNTRYFAAGQAFEPAAVSYLVPINENIDALRACKQAGCTLVLASNWRTDCFKQLIEQKATKEVMTLFDADKRFISEDLKMLTSNTRFFDQIKETCGKDRHYFYADIDLGKESLDAAHKAGMTPLAVSPESSLALLFEQHQVSIGK